MTSQFTHPPAHADDAWKAVLHTYFAEFMQFFFPAFADKIDWNAGFAFKDKELQILTNESLTSNSNSA